MRTLTSPKEFKKFAKEFSFITGPLLGWITKSTRCPWKITVKYDVAVADSETLYIQPEMPKRWRYSDNFDFVGFYTGDAWAYNKNGHPAHYVEYSDNRFLPFLKTVINKDDIERVVLTRELHWHKLIPDWEKKGLDSPCGDLFHLIYEIHIIKKPAGGFWNLVNNSELYRNVNILDYQRIKKAAFEDGEAEKTVQEMEVAVSKFYDKTNSFFQRLFSEKPSKQYEKNFPNTKLVVIKNDDQYFLEISSAYSSLYLILSVSGKKPPEISCMNSTVDFAKTMLRDISEHAPILLIGL
jgi:hypothetical protein